MILFTETNLAQSLRDKCNDAKKRIWIVSPFVGDAKNVDCILGPSWSNNDIERKLIFDAVSGSMSKDTLKSFIDLGVQIKSLRSVHAKIYIVDDWCLITSANMTGTAFSKRIEIGNEISSDEELSIIVRYFNKWWALAENVTLDSKVNTIETKQDFDLIKELPKPVKSQKVTTYKHDFKDLNSGEYCINGINIRYFNKSNRKCLILRCRTNNMFLCIDSFVAIYDPIIIGKYDKYLSTLGKSSLNYEQCKDLPDDLRYIKYMKRKSFKLECPHMRIFIKDISKGTYGTLLEDYDGWEYDCAMSQPPPPTGIWWIDKVEEEEWVKNPFPPEAIPAKHYDIDVFVCVEDGSIVVNDRFFKEIKEYMIEDFYTEYTEKEFPRKKNRLH